MELISQAELARRLKLTRASILYAIRKEQLNTYGEGKDIRIDFMGDETIDYINRINEKQKSGKIPNKKKPGQRKKKPKLVKTKPRKSNEQVNTIDEGKLRQDFQANPNSLSRSDVERLKVVEQTNALIIKNEKDRNQLIARQTVQRVISKHFTIEFNQLRSMPANITPELAALCKVDDTLTLLHMEKLLDEEIFSVLKSIKKLLHEFLEGIGTDGLAATCE